ncbi:hypothetical protein FK529_00770 [Tsukamurella asaccharolytica]|uniref:TY-Chap C-terminal domain-containing protein n=1 Tax=Tsukamurella asaccharolytica TaxID=2592067 RepID=A0A5C5REQ3_9ACTN|nr:hypothetical protein [Tsukamurella asaccharolytica]TWS21182.1 hypothetical protein FK529_00770 [Tsukamurella asaccharolytica]
METHDSPLDDSEDWPTARDADGWPGGVALLYLDRPSGTLTPAQTAFVLGNDAEYIEELMLDEEDEAAQWAYDAHRARLGDPDPDLVAASPAGVDGLEEACLEHARLATVAAQAKRFALNHLRSHPQEPPEYSILEAMDRVQSAAEAVFAPCRDCDDCQAHAGPCREHAGAVAAAQAHLDAAVAAMRTEMLEAFAAFTTGARAFGVSPEERP